MGVLDIEYNSGNAALKELLLSIDRPGDFCAHGKLFAPMPRLEVEGVGLLSFPVPDMQVRALLAAVQDAGRHRRHRRRRRRRLGGSGVGRQRRGGGRAVGHLFTKLIGLWPTDGDHERDRAGCGRVLDLLSGIGDEARTRRFLLDVVLSRYRPGDNGHLPAAIAIVGPDAAERFLADVATAHVTRHPGPVLALLRVIQEQGRESAAAAWGGALRKSVHAALLTLCEALAARTGDRDEDEPKAAFGAIRVPPLKTRIGWKTIGPRKTMIRRRPNPGRRSGWSIAFATFSRPFGAGRRAGRALRVRPRQNCARRSRPGTRPDEGGHEDDSVVAGALNSANRTFCGRERTSTSRG